jgi:DNA-binding response OmpR family regulator
MYRDRPRVLIVEDDILTSRMIGQIFEFYGFQHVHSYTAADGRSSLDIPVDLILLDVMLPDAPGTEVLRAVRALKLQAVVAIWTALPLAELGEILALKPDILLHKPSSLEELQAVATRIRGEFKPKEMS